MDSNTSLTDLYQQIKNLTSAGASVYEKIQHVEQYGALPEEKEKDPVDPVTLSELKNERRKLNDYISKQKGLLKKANSAKPLTPQKRQEIEQRLQVAMVKRDSVINKIIDLAG